MQTIATKTGRFGQTITLTRREDGKHIVREAAHSWSDPAVCGGQVFKERARNIYMAFDLEAATSIYKGAQ